MNIKLVLDTTEFDRFVKEYPLIIIEEMNSAIEKSAYKIESMAKQEAPAVSGKLRQKIMTSLSYLKGVVSANALYSIYVHEGTKPHIITPKTKKVLADKRKRIIFGKRVRHPGTEPNRFMLRAVEKSKNTIEGYFQKALENTIRKAIR